MIMDDDLNDFRKTLETYFKNKPEGPKILQLNQTLGLKLLDLLNNLEEVTIDSIIPQQEINHFSQYEIMPYVHSDMARKIASKMIADKYVTFLQSNDFNPLGVVKIRASAILWKRGENI